MAALGWDSNFMDENWTKKTADTKKDSVGLGGWTTIAKPNESKKLRLEGWKPRSEKALRNPLDWDAKSRKEFFPGGEDVYRKRQLYLDGYRAKGRFQGGRITGLSDLGVPAILHGGEYVINKASVDKYGIDLLSRINKGIFSGAKQYKVGGYVSNISVPEIPKYVPPMSTYAKIVNGGVGVQSLNSESTHNYNFYVDNFLLVKKNGLIQ